MENIFFSKTIADNYNNQFLTIGDFVKICDVIKVGVFEVMIENHPKNREVKYNVYKNMSEYISTVPECFPKEETDPSSGWTKCSCTLYENFRRVIHCNLK